MIEKEMCHIKRTCTDEIDENMYAVDVSYSS